MLEEILLEGFNKMGLAVEPSQLAAFRAYYELLQKTNAVMNLTAITGEEDSARLHFLDSAAPLTRFSMAGAAVIDVGSGAGFPGLPLRLLCPELRLTLLDSLGKRVDFLKSVCAALDLRDVECIHGRAEDCGQRREAFDFAVSRAVARLNILAELCLPYVKPGGVFLALKGPALEAELGEAERAIPKLGGALEEVIPYEIPGVEARHSLAVIRKVSPTPRQYPRPFGKIKKSPL